MKMGTRNLTMVELKGQLKVAQYGQWDGNPMGQGLTILNFILKELNTDSKIEDFKIMLSECKFLTKEESDKLYNSEGWRRNFPQLSRDTGAEILDLINNGFTTNLIDSSKFASDSLFCEYAYLINLDNNTLEIYKGFNKIDLTEKDRFYYLKDEEPNSEYKPIKIWKTFNFSDLKEDTMKKLEESEESE